MPEENNWLSHDRQLATNAFSILKQKPHGISKHHPHAQQSEENKADARQCKGNEKGESPLN